MTRIPISFRSEGLGVELLAQRLFLRHAFLPILELGTRTRFWSMYRESARFDYRPDDVRDQLRRQRLSRLLSLAVNSKLHIDRLQQAGMVPGPVKPDDAFEVLTRLAALTKSKLRQHFPQGATTNVDSADWRYVSTSGTTDRMTILADFHKRDANRSSEMHVLRVALGSDVGSRMVEVPPNACNVVCGAVETGPSGFLAYLWHAVRQRTIFKPEAKMDLRNRFERRVLFRRTTLPPIDPLPTAQRIEMVDYLLEQIRLERPAQVRGFPLYLLWMADRLTEKGRSIESVRLISPYGGLASSEMRKRISAGFAAPFGDVYGTSELGSVGASCGQSPGVHVFEDSFIAEVVRGGKPVAPGEVGQLLLTDLINTAMPLIRYQVGDAARLHLGSCPCGRTTARLEILGRMQEVLVTPKEPLTPTEIADAAFVDPSVANFRIEEVEPNEFEATLVANPEANPDIRAWEDRFKQLHGGVRKIRTRLAALVRPEASGKYRFVHPFPRTVDPL